MIYGIIGSYGSSTAYSHEIRSFINLALSEEFGSNLASAHVISGCDETLNIIIRSFCAACDIPCAVIPSGHHTDDDSLTLKDRQIIDNADVVIIFLSREVTHLQEVITHADRMNKPIRVFELPVFKIRETPLSVFPDDDTDMGTFCPRDPYEAFESDTMDSEDIVLFICRIRSLCGYTTVIPSTNRYLNRCFDAYLTGNETVHIFLNPETGNPGVEETNRRIIAHASFVLSLSPCFTAERRALIAFASQSGIDHEFITDSLFFENESMKTPGMKSRDLILRMKEYLGLAEFAYRITDCEREKGLYLVENRDTNPLRNI